MKIQDILAPWSDDRVERMQAKWLLLTDRDQLALKILAIFFTVLFVWLLIAPIVTWVQHKQANYEETHELLAWMHSHEALAKQAAQQQSSVSNVNSAQSLLATINATAQPHHIVIKRIEPDGDTGVRLWLENIAYQDMVLWLFELDNQHAIHVKQITVNKQSAQGYVSGTIIFGS